MPIQQKLHKGVLHWLYDKGWGELRSIQQQSLETYLSSDADMILCARTAGGKTEAAFLPIVSALAEDYAGGVRAVYIGPLRALINDQFRRMEELCQYLEIPVHRWHGEVSQSAKKKLIKDPGGILLITPESIESLFLNRSKSIAALFSKLDCCVIDEMHVFPGTERGQQLRSLLHRLEQVSKHTVRRIGLSATLANPEDAANWLRHENPAQVHILHAAHEDTEFKTRIYTYRYEIDKGSAAREGLLDVVPHESQLTRDLVAHHERGTALIFANARGTVEDVATRTRDWYAANKWDTDRIYVHHGSVSRDLRERAEQSLHAGGDKLCFCTSTLELGVDLGDVRSVAHIGAAHSAASSAQRLGRSGRRPGEATIYRQYIRINPIATLIDEAALCLQLLRAIALVDCYLHKWVEPITTNKFHLSTFVHQVMTVIAQHHGRTAQQLFMTLCAKGNFHWVSQKTFMHILRSLGEHHVISQMSDGTLLLDTVGEELVESRDIYAVFQSVEDWQVECSGNKIGTIPLENVLLRGDKLLLAGRHWVVQQTHDEDKVLEVMASQQGKPALYGGDPCDIHAELLRRMQTFLESDNNTIVYCDEASQAVLRLAQQRYRDHVKGRFITPLEKGVVLWTWAGTQVNRTLKILLQQRLPAVEFDYGHASVDCACDRQSVEEALTEIAAIGDLCVHLIRFVSQEPRLMCIEKYDHLLPVQELSIQYVQDGLDVEGAEKWLAFYGAGR